VRSALQALTVRGRAFLASGLTSILCGLVLIERDLTRMGLLVAALPLVSAMYVAGRSHHLRLHRTVTPPHLNVGESAKVQVNVENGGAPTSVLLMEEQLPYALGGRPRFVIQPMGRGIAWLDTGTYDSLLSSSQFVQTLEERQGLKVACIEEIAFAKGFIDAAQLSRLAEHAGKSEYAAYLQRVLKDAGAN